MSLSPVAGCVAGVTVYRPDEALLLSLLDRLREEGLPILVHIDGPADEAAGDDLLATLRARPDATVLQSAQNGGIGSALNRLAEAARARGARSILLMDQDSDLPAGTVAALVEDFARLEAAGVRFAAIGPRPVAPPGEAIKPPRYRRRPSPPLPAPLVGVDFIITSGSLVPLDAWRAVGPFREDYFIDAIDVEWCLRAWDRGYAVVLDAAALLPHRIGGGILRVGPLAFPEQPEARMLTYTRNQAHMLRLPHVPLRWKLRTLLYVPVQAAAKLSSGPQKIARLKSYIRAVANGLAARFER